MTMTTSLKISRTLASRLFLKPQFHHHHPNPIPIPVPVPVPVPSCLSCSRSSSHPHHLQSNPNPNLKNLNAFSLQTSPPSLSDHLKPFRSSPISSLAITNPFNPRFYSTSSSSSSPGSQPSVASSSSGSQSKSESESESNESPISSSSSSESSEYPSKNPEFKHQEIEGPTVDRDLSPLANETREVTLRLMKTMYHTSTALALLGLSHLAFTACFSFSHSDSESLWLITGSSFISFAFPFSMAFMLRRSLKSMHFFHKMELIGRLQILTSTMQISKLLHLFFLRLRTLTYLSLAGLPLAFSLSLLSSYSSS